MARTSVGGVSGTTTITTEDKFRDPVWEANGYDLDIVQYRTDKGGAPLAADWSPDRIPGTLPPLVPAADKFVGLLDGAGLLGQDVLHLAARPAYAGEPDPGAAGYVGRATGGGATS